MVVITVPREWTAVAAASSEGLIVEFDDVVKFARIVRIFDTDIPRTLFGVRTDGACLAELDQHVLIACVFKYVVDVIRDESLRYPVEGELHARAIETNRLRVVIDVLPSGAFQCCGDLVQGGRFIGFGELLEVFCVGLPERLDGRVEQAIAQCVGLIDRS